jgi:LysR family transcriptional regulator for bpeEF and oprC
MVAQAAETSRSSTMINSGGSSQRLGSIAIFVCVGESASFTEAAKILQMTVSGVSRAISRLENSLGVRLLKRTARSTSLTDEGARYLECCKQIVSDLENAEHEIANSKSKPRGRLRLQVPRALGRQIIVPSLARFHTKYPDVTVEVVLDGRSFNLDEAGIDIALRYGIPANSPLVGRKLCPVFYLACASPGYIRQFGAPACIEDLHQHNPVGHIIAQDGRCRAWHFNDQGTTRSIAISSGLNVNDMFAVADIAVNDGGIAYLADFVAAEYLKSGALVPVLKDAVFEGVPIYMAHARTRHTTSRFRVLREFIRSLFPSPTPWSQVVLAGRAHAAAGKSKNGKLETK